jgi:FtsZ-binding cell division protein ZapB
MKKTRRSQDNEFLPPNKLSQKMHWERKPKGVSLFVSKETLTSLLDSLYKETKLLLQNQEMENMSIAIRNDLEVSAAEFFTLCSQYQKYEKLKETVNTLSEAHSSIKNQIESLDSYRDTMKTEYESVNEHLQESISKLLNSIESDTIVKLQRDLDTAAKRFHSAQKSRKTILANLANEQTCVLCNDAVIDSVLLCGHQGCEGCLESNPICGCCGERTNGTVIRLKSSNKTLEEPQTPTTKNILLTL